MTNSGGPTDRPWARHYFDSWQRRAGDRRLPHWLQVTAAAYGSHEDNGHARFKRGDLSLILGHVDETGRVVPYSNLGRAIATAVEYGWLARGSYWGCLIVPAHDIRKGLLDRTPRECPLHAKHIEAQGKGAGSYGR